MIRAADFWSRVRKTRGCWLWGGRTKGRYGSWKNMGAHRVAYLLSGRQIPEGYFVLHSCDVKKCVKPNHLRAGTLQDNAKDAVERRKTAHGSINGHARLTKEAVVDIYTSKTTVKEMSEKYHVAPQTICSIRKDRNWVYVTEKLKPGFKLSNESHMGESSNYAVLTEKQVRAILRSQKSNQELALKYRVEDCTIRGIRLNKTWKHIERSQYAKYSAAWEPKPHKILNDARVVEILMSRAPQKVLAEKYGVKCETINDIRHNRTWRHIDRKKLGVPDKIIIDTKHGETCNLALLTEKEALEILHSKEPRKVLMQRYGVSYNCIAGIQRGIRWKHLSGEKNESVR